ncbi:succinylglutamate desuccinylase/aspartoacylase family protein [Candidatus Woesearchaeota archaeon]|nr:succinylglutamate desuccinylase/aspartoacylase family protein [Candidatus Woesearchaeota archaeon]
MENLQVGSCKGVKGEKTKGHLEINLDSLKIKIPVFIISGVKDGPTAFISAGMHGDEVNGIHIVKKIKESITPESLSGRLVIVPVVNTLGFKESKRTVPLDDQDLNRQFNKNNPKTASELIAHAFFEEVVRKCDFGIDCHDSNAENILLPHSRVLSRKEAPEIAELSRIFGTDLILEREGKEGMLAIEAYREYKIPVLTVEIGGGVKVWDKYVLEGIRGIKNVLIYKKMLNGLIDVPIRQFVLDYRYGYKAPFSGILDVKIELGDAVNEGEIIATLYDPENDREKEIKAEHPGVVFSVRLKSKIDADEVMFSVLHFKQDKNEMHALNAEMILNKEVLQSIIVRPTKVLDTFLAIFDSSYSLIDNVIGDRLEKIKKYFKK